MSRKKTNSWIELPPAALEVLNNEPAFYLASLEQQFQRLRHFLRGTILDIGCGLAGIDALAARHGLAREFHLLDGDGTGPKVQGFSSYAPAPWNDVRIGAEVVATNAPPGVEIRTHAADPTLTIPADVILSLRAWGHHFPVSVYAGLARRSLRPGGRIIMDIRRGSGGIADMAEAGFAIYSHIPDPSAKCDRWVFRSWKLNSPKLP